MSNIDFYFISELEGGTSCTGYVPDAGNSKSGVTIATGFDIGQRFPDDLYRLLPRTIAFKLAGYCEVTGEKAAQLLASKPLVITEFEAKTIDICYKRKFAEKLQHRYNQLSNVRFEQLPEQAQTVIASVAFQYGDLSKRCPKFWQVAISQNWQTMENELRNFGDRYSTRRNLEADYLTTAYIESK